MIKKDCGKCREKEERLVIFNDGDIHLTFWCDKYNEPCIRAVKNCNDNQKKEKMRIEWEA